LSGTGNWPQIAALPVRDVPEGFKVVHPQLQRTPEAGKIFDAKLTEDLVLVPSEAGHFVLPAVHWVYFDPDLGVFQTVSTEPAPIDVTGAAVAETETSAEALRLPAAVLSLGDLTAAPLSGTLLWIAAGAPFILLLFGWFALALRDARQNDPGMLRRRAWLRQRDRLMRIQMAANGNDTAALRKFLLEWQRDAVTTWGLPQASPTPESIGDRAEGALWAEADGAIFGPKAELPPDWLVRADQSLAAVPPPPFRRSRALAPRHLFPFALMAIAALSLGAAGTDVSNAAGNDEAAKFAEAEPAWRAAPALDAAGKHDVSVALARQGKWGEAVPFAAEAFVRDPAQREIRSQFTATCDRASVDPGPLTRFLAPDPWHRLVQTASPARWQRGAIVAAWIAALGLLLLLLRGYGVLRGARAPIAGLVGLGIGLVGGMISFAAARAYGAAGNAESIWVLRPTVMRPIPTEVAGVQAGTTVPPGAIGVPDREFLNWTRMRFDNGTVGWIREADTTPLWK
jgi:hypothetical protein